MEDHTKRFFALIVIIMVMIPVGFTAIPVLFKKQLSTIQPAKIVFVDVERVFNESSLGKATQGDIQKQSEEKAAELRRLVAQLDDIKRQVDRLAKAGKITQAKALVPQYKRIEQQAIALQQSAGKDAASSSDKAFLAQLKTTLETIRQKEGYDVILPKTDTNPLAMDPKLDVTQTVLDGLNTSAK